MNKNVMKKIAIYIDASRLLSGKAYGLEVYIDELAELLNNNKNDLILLVNDVLKKEINYNISLIEFPESKLKNCINEDQIENLKKSFEDNKTKYLEKIDKLFKLAKKIDIKMSNDEIIDGVEREYNKELPWSKKDGKKDGKPNEWKDFFVQKSLVNYINLDEYKPIILTGDGDFEGMPKGFEIQKQPLKDFLPYIKNQYLKQIEDFKSYLISKIYSDIEEDITEEIKEYYQEYDSDIYDYYRDKYYDYTAEIEEISINDVEILDFTNIERIEILVRARIYGFLGDEAMDYSNDRGETYLVRSSKDVEYYMTCSFTGKYDNIEFVKNQMDGKEDSNIVKLIGIDK